MHAHEERRAALGGACRGAADAGDEEVHDLARPARDTDVAVGPVASDGRQAGGRSRARVRVLIRAREERQDPAGRDVVDGDAVDDELDAHARAGELGQERGGQPDGALPVPGRSVVASGARVLVHLGASAAGRRAAVLGPVRWW